MAVLFFSVVPAGLQTASFPLLCSLCPPRELPSELVHTTASNALYHTTTMRELILISWLLGFFFYTHLNQTRLPWDPYHGKCSIWNKAIFCHSLVFPAALVNEMNPATSREQKNTYIKDEMWIIIRLCLFLCCTWCGYVFCPPHWLAGRV